ncbi:DNA-directed DNA polymerase [Cadophora gregata]|uniref:DNA-directed DNA polymerase n=1 Tax=Cadophora gregata TaxID=51156 RepID=UPI0026DAB767|nr:DNA-directed DNA polymerase [Cadophora gregata]KAK0108516.1 DNA-directed DNA polymerase [Cadophora gregata]KAK0108889.1 DNA-directed DNA polymerase [Cadophora gregata f. sp. sojae]
MGQKRKRAAKDGPSAEQNPNKQQKTEEKVEKRAVKPAVVPVPLDTSPFLDNPKGADLKREVQLYDLLSSEDIEDRLNAANAVLSGLLGGNGVEESTLQRHLERRLFRGLASGRKCARLGFSVVLAEIIGQLFGTKNLAETKYPGLTFDKVLGFLIAKTKPDGDLSGQEEKDHFLGLLFGLESFVGAKILFGEDNKWNTILQKFLELAKKKPWTREQCGWVIAEALSQMDQIQAEYTLEQIHNAGLALSPEGVGIWITARGRFPDMKFPSKPWGSSGNPLEHLKTLGKALKESSSDEGSDKSQQAKQTGNWNAKLHFVWDLVLAQYIAGVKAKVHGIKSDFENFWKVAVDENLFSSTASRERKFWGFLLFQKVVENATSYGKVLPSVFSHNLVRCLINHVQEKDRFLHRAADKSLKVLISAVEANPKLLVTILPCLIGGHGTYNFDRVTKTKTVERLLSFVEDSSATAVINTLVDPALSISGDDVKEAEMRRQMLGDYILNIIRKVNITDESRDLDWIKETALPTLARFAYVEEAKCKPALSTKTRTIFRTRLMSSFGHLLSDLQGYTFPCDLLRSFTPDAVEMDQGITDAKDSAISTVEKILKRAKKANAENKAPLQALALLYSLVVFQLYSGEPEAVSILDELKLCYDKLIRHKETEDSEVDASEVLVELLLSFISKPSALLRKVTQHVFGAFMSDMTAGGLQLMTDVLESGESLRGQQELFDQEPEDGEDMDVDEDDEEDSDVEVVDMDGDEGHLNGHLHEEEDEESDDEEDEASGEEEDEDAEKLNLALAQALGTHLPGQDGDDEDSDADMTDSEMMQLDAKLVEIFSARKKAPNKKQERKDAKETMVNFKGRVLDLLEIFAKKQASNPLAFGLLLPLLQLIRTTKAKQLAEKAHNIILAFAKASKAAKKDGVAEINASEQIKLLKAVHLEASKDPSHLFARAASSASLLVASSLYRVDKGSVKKIATVYRDSQVAWVEGEVKMQAAFFVDWVNWCQSHANA